MGGLYGMQRQKQPCRNQSFCLLQKLLDPASPISQQIPFSVAVPVMIGLKSKSKAKMKTKSKTKSILPLLPVDLLRVIVEGSSLDLYLPDSQLMSNSAL